MAAFGHIFCNRTAALYSGIRTVFRVNGHLYRASNITFFIRQECPHLSLMVLWTTAELAALISIPWELMCGRSMSVNTNDASVIEASHMPVFLMGKKLTEYTSATSANSNSEKSLLKEANRCSWTASPWPDNGVTDWLNRFGYWSV